jgi:hypothetical protein
MPNIAIDHKQIRAFCARWQITSLALFGSVLREDFRPDSDVDVLVTFAPEARITLFDLAAMARELADLFGRKVDLVERLWIEHSHNPIRRREILTTAQEVYRAAA